MTRMTRINIDSENCEKDKNHENILEDEHESHEPLARRSQLHEYKDEHLKTPFVKKTMDVAQCHSFVH